MPVFVHLIQEKEKTRIQRSGIRKSRIHLNNTDAGVFCMPVINDYFATHQWLREIKRFEKKNITGIYFRVGSSEPVWYGYYFETHKKGTAAEAVEAFMRMNDKMGFQVIIPRNIHRETNNSETMAVCAEAIINIKGQEGFDYLKEYENIENVKSILDEYKEIFTCDTTK